MHIVIEETQVVEQLHAVGDASFFSHDQISAKNLRSLAEFPIRHIFMFPSDVWFDALRSAKYAVAQQTGKAQGNLPISINCSSLSFCPT